MCHHMLVCEKIVNKIEYYPVSKGVVSEFIHFANNSKYTLRIPPNEWKPVKHWLADWSETK